MKNILMLLGGGAVVAYIAYRVVLYKEGANGSVPLIGASSVTAKNSGQNAVNPQPRVDNSNQAYYGGSNAFQGQPAQYPNSTTSAAAAISAGASIIHSLSDLFGSTGVGNLFSSNNDFSNTSDQLASLDYNSDGSMFDANDSGMGSLDLQSESFDYSATA